MLNRVYWKKLPNPELGEEKLVEQELDFEDTSEGQERMLNFYAVLLANEGVLVEEGSIKTVRPGDLVENLMGEITGELIGAEGIVS